MTSRRSYHVATTASWLQHAFQHPSVGGRLDEAPHLNHITMNALQIYVVDEERFDPVSRHPSHGNTAPTKSLNAYAILLQAPAATLAGNVANRADVKSNAILGYN
ncbi:hypothetical protein [Caballeronia hypogeia]|uniref:hypothetical protein n=1 Tax=Caballeronia hypogeia TaxID=1777140 RepID=UPI0012FE3EC1|nr:hypothetical protein [Caballeronia hypogeia]